MLHAVVSSCDVTVLQGWTCYCHPCVPTAAPQQHGPVAVYANLGVAAFTIILIVAALVLAAVGVLIFKLKKEFNMPPVSAGSPGLMTLNLRLLGVLHSLLMCHTVAASVTVIILHVSPFLHFCIRLHQSAGPSWPGTSVQQT